MSIGIMFKADVYWKRHLFKSLEELNTYIENQFYIIERIEKHIINETDKYPLIDLLDELKDAHEDLTYAILLQRNWDKYNNCDYYKNLEKELGINKY